MKLANVKRLSAELHMSLNLREYTLDQGPVSVMYRGRLGWRTHLVQRQTLHPEEKCN